jgi:hypothetical protein
MRVKQTTTVWGDTKARICSLCGDVFAGMGNNPEPLKPFAERCCDDCNWARVIPARLASMSAHRALNERELDAFRKGAN